LPFKTQSCKLSTTQTPTKFWRHEREWYARNADCRQNRTALWAWLLQGVDRDAAVLEVGCGEGQVLDMLATLGFTDLMGCDINETALARAAPTYRGICADISSLPFSDETYDLGTRHTI
jgi:SAM-dependent methyltransferase